MDKHDGGPAFPIHPSMRASDDQSSAEGMTLRDWFAGQALATVINRYAYDNHAGIGVDHLPRNCAAHAYRIADAMLKERESTNER